MTLFYDGTELSLTGFGLLNLAKLARNAIREAGDNEVAILVQPVLNHFSEPQKIIRDHHSAVHA